MTETTKYENAQVYFIDDKNKKINLDLKEFMGLSLVGENKYDIVFNHSNHSLTFVNSVKKSDIIKKITGVLDDVKKRYEPLEKITITPIDEINEGC